MDTRPHGVLVLDPQVVRRAPQMSAGQALTELALVLPMLALLFIGALDLGRAFHTQVALANAARVGIIYAQQVASPRQLDCLPGTTCYFITVADVISATKNESQGGIDASQMQVSVCLQHVVTCPVTNTSEAVVSNEGITVTVSAPFTPITPFVHLTRIGGTVSGHTFSFEPVAAPLATMSTNTPTVIPTATNTPTVIPTATNTPTVIPTATNTPTPAATNTPGGPTATQTPVLPTATQTPTSAPTATATSISTLAPTSTPTNTAIPGPTATATLEPIPTISPSTGPTLISTGNGANTLVTIAWSTQYPASDVIRYRPHGTTAWTLAFGTHSGTSGSNTFGRQNSGATIILGNNTYDYEVESTTTGGTTSFPSDGQSCFSDCPTFSL